MCYRYAKFFGQIRLLLLLLLLLHVCIVYSIEFPSKCHFIEFFKTVHLGPITYTSQSMDYGFHNFLVSKPLGSPRVNTRNSYSQRLNAKTQTQRKLRHSAPTAFETSEHPYPSKFHLLSPNSPSQFLNIYSQFARSGSYEIRKQNILGKCTQQENSITSRKQDSKIILSRPRWRGVPNEPAFNVRYTTKPIPCKTPCYDLLTKSQHTIALGGPGGVPNGKYNTI